MAFPGMKPVNLTNLSNAQPHHVDYSSGVGVHVQNRDLNQPIFHERQGNFLVQRTDPHPVAQPGAELFGEAYTQQVLKQGLYRDKTPHSNLPVMDPWNIEFPVVAVTPDNANQNVVHSTNKEKRAVLFALEGGSNFINPPMMAVKGGSQGNCMKPPRSEARFA